MSELISLGISHKTAPVEIRERVSLGERDAERLLRDLTAHDEVQEAVAISTCNRTELYLVSNDPVQAEADVLGRLATRAGIRPTDLAHVVYTPRNCDAARQLYRVAAGLESMIVGEAEVQGQVRRAYDLALAAGTTGPLTNRLFRAALEAGKRVRSQTGIGDRRVSVSTVAVELARDTVGDLSRRAVIVIGAGETSERTAQALATRASRRSSSPTATPTAPARSPTASAGPWARSTSCRTACSRPTSSSLRPPRRTRSSAPRSSSSSCRAATGVRSS